MLGCSAPHSAHAAALSGDCDSAPELQSGSQGFTELPLEVTVAAACGAIEINISVILENLTEDNMITAAELQLDHLLTLSSRCCIQIDR